MSPKVVRNIEIAAVLAASAGLLIWVPERWFLEVALTMLAGAIAGVMAVKKYTDRLYEKAKALESSGRPDEATVLRVRQRMLVDIGMALAIVGLTAFFGLIVVYGD